MLGTRIRIYSNITMYTWSRSCALPRPGRGDIRETSRGPTFQGILGLVLAFYVTLFLTDWLTGWLTKLKKNITIEHSKRLVALKNCDQKQNINTWFDQQKDNEQKQRQQDTSRHLIIVMNWHDLTNQKDKKYIHWDTKHFWQLITMTLTFIVTLQ